MGPDAEDVLQTTDITADEHAAYVSVIQKFDDHFGVRKNVTYERARGLILKNSNHESLEHNAFWLCMHSPRTASTQENERNKLYVTISLWVYMTLHFQNNYKWIPN